MGHEQGYLHKKYPDVYDENDVAYPDWSLPDPMSAAANLDMARLRDALTAYQKHLVAGEVAVIEGFLAWLRSQP